VRDGLITIVKRHVAEVDFPVEIARGTRIVGVKGRSALGIRGCNSKEEKQEEDCATHHTEGPGVTRKPRALRAQEWPTVDSNSE